MESISTVLRIQLNVLEILAAVALYLLSYSEPQSKKNVNEDVPTQTRGNNPHRKQSNPFNDLHVIIWRRVSIYSKHLGVLLSLPTNL